MKKIIVMFLIVANVIFISIPVKADDIEEEWEEIKEEDILNVSTNVDNVPKLNSRAALILDRDSGRVLYEKNGYSKRPMASTTKIMTAIVVLEHTNLQETVEISRKAGGTGGSRLGLKQGDKITVNDLLYGLMLRSGNDAAVALAEKVGGSIEGFADLMNQKAQELGLQNTHFVTPHGLDEQEHYTSAYELACITDYALKNKKFVAMVGTKNCNITINGGARNLNNTNELLGYLNGVDGVKTGFTNGAGRCLVTSTTRNGHQIICVVLGADTKKYRTQDSIKLIEYAFSNYEYLDIRQKIQEEFDRWCKEEAGQIKVLKGEKEQIYCILEQMDVTKFPVLKDHIKDIKLTVHYENILEAPIMKNQIIGKIEVKEKDEILMSINIEVKEEIRKKNIANYLVDLIENYTNYFVQGLENWS